MPDVIANTTAFVVTYGVWPVAGQHVDRQSEVHENRPIAPWDAEEYEQDRRFLLELWAILDPIFHASALHNAALAPDEAT